MKIRDIQTYLVGNPWKTWLFIRVDTDEGLHGIGEGTLGQFSQTVASAVQKMKSMILGYDPFGIEAILLRLTRDMDADGGQIQIAACTPNHFMQEHFDMFNVDCGGETSLLGHLNS